MPERRRRSSIWQTAVTQGQDAGRRLTQTLRRASSSASVVDLDEMDASDIMKTNIWSSHRLVAPESANKKQWDILIFIIAMYSCFVVSTQAAFQVQMIPAWLVMDYCFDILYYFDIVLHFNIVYLDEHHDAVVDRKLIAKRYMEYYFWQDLSVNFPWELLALFASKGAVRDWFFYLRLPRMGRILQIGRSSALDKLYTGNASRMLLLTCWLFLTAHIVACMWWSVGMWAFNMESESGQEWPRRSPANDPTWKQHGALGPDPSQSPFMQQYTSSLYWALTTLIKTPWCPPDTTAEKAYTSFMVVLGAIILSAYMGNMNSTVDRMDRASAVLRNRLKLWHDFGHQYRIPNKYVKQIVQHEANQTALYRGLDNINLLRGFPRRLRGEVVLGTYRELADNCPLLQGIHQELVKELLQRAQPQAWMPQEMLMVKGEFNEWNYILIHGTLQINALQHGLQEDLSGLLPDPHQVEYRETFPRKSQTMDKIGSVICFKSPFDRTERFPFTVEVVRQSKVLRIRRGDVAAVLSAYGGPDALQVITSLTQVHEKMVKSINVLEGDNYQESGAKDGGAGYEVRAVAADGPAPPPPTIHMPTELQPIKSESTGDEHTLAELCDLRDRMERFDRKLQSFGRDLLYIQHYLELVPRIFKCLGHPDPPHVMMAQDGHIVEMLKLAKEQRGDDQPRGHKQRGEMVVPTPPQPPSPQQSQPKQPQSASCEDVVSPVEISLEPQRNLTVDSPPPATSCPPCASAGSNSHSYGSPLPSPYQHPQLRRLRERNGSPRMAGPTGPASHGFSPPNDEVGEDKEVLPREVQPPERPQTPWFEWVGMVLFWADFVLHLALAGWLHTTYAGWYSIVGVLMLVILYINSMAVVTHFRQNPQLPVFPYITISGILHAILSMVNIELIVTLLPQNSRWRRQLRLVSVLTVMAADIPILVIQILGLVWLGLTGNELLLVGTIVSILTLGMMTVHLLRLLASSTHSTFHVTKKRNGPNTEQEMMVEELSTDPFESRRVTLEEIWASTPPSRKAWLRQQQIDIDQSEDLPTGASPSASMDARPSQSLGLAVLQNHQIDNALLVSPASLESSGAGANGGSLPLSRASPLVPLDGEDDCVRMSEDEEGSSHIDYKSMIKRQYCVTNRL